MNTTKVIVTQTSRNGRRIGFHAFTDRAELFTAINQTIDLDHDPESGTTVQEEKHRAYCGITITGRYIGYGGQWIVEPVRTDAELSAWNMIQAERSPGMWPCTAIDPAWARTPITARTKGLPPHARFILALMPKLWQRLDERGHMYVTFTESRYLMKNDLHQPGHALCRYSTPNEDLSDLTAVRYAEPATA